MSQKEITEGLQKILADSFVLYFKTHSFHWNVTGPHFKALHDLFMEQYTEIWTAVDEIAERIRILDEFGPTSYKTMLGQASLDEVTQVPDAENMVKMLADDNLAIVDVIKPVLEKAAEAGDEGTVDLLTTRITTHEKAAWMLRSSLSKSGCCC